MSTKTTTIKEKIISKLSEKGIQLVVARNAGTVLSLSRKGKYDIIEKWESNRCTTYYNGVFFDIIEVFKHNGTDENSSVRIRLVTELYHTYTNIYETVKICYSYSDKKIDKLLDKLIKEFDNIIII